MNNSPKQEHAKRLKVYKFFGMEFKDENDKELIATCPFCGKDRHFYVNKQSALFDCKRCSNSGTYIDYLTATYNQLKDFNDPSHLEKLANHRQLPLEAFDNKGIIYVGEKYWIPIYNYKNKVQDLRYHILGKHLYSIDGVDVGIFNLKDLIDESRKSEPIYICEGEFDAIALIWLLKKTNKKGIVVGVPGANILKKDWYDWFTGRELINCFDNDNAGETGYNKEKAKLNGYISLKKIFWPPETPRSYDVNQFVATYGVAKNNYEQCYQILSSLIRNENEEQAIVEEIKQTIVPNNLDFKTLLIEYRKNLEINREYEDAIKVMLATILSICIPGENPLWLFFVGPPSSGKTAILNTAKFSNLCHFESSLGRHMLVSGWKMLSGADPSVFSRLNNKCFILKDFTEVLFKSATDRDEIFSCLRGAFDGTVDRSFGNGVVRKYKVRFSMLAGVTQEINSFPQASAGDRFLRYNFTYDIQNVEKQQEMAFKQAIFGEKVKEELQAFVSKFLENKFDFSIEHLRNYINDKELYKFLKPLARLIAYLRTPVIRFEKGRKNELPIYEPIPEVGNRTGIQLQRLAISLAILEGKDTIDEEIYRIVKKVAFDTVESYATRIVKILYKSQEELTKGEISTKLHSNFMDLSPYLEDLQLLKIIEIKPRNIGGKITNGYYISPAIFELFTKVEQNL